MNQFFFGFKTLMACCSATPIKQALREIDETFKRDQERANRPFPPELFEQIIEARGDEDKK